MGLSSPFQKVQGDTGPKNGQEQPRKAKISTRVRTLKRRVVGFRHVASACHFVCGFFFFFHRDTRCGSIASRVFLAALTTFGRHFGGRRRPFALFRAFLALRWWCRCRRVVWWTWWRRVHRNGRNVGRRSVDFGRWGGRRR